MLVAFSTQNIQTLRRGLRNFFALALRGEPVMVLWVLSVMRGGQPACYSSAKGSDSSRSSSGGGAGADERLLAAAAATGARSGAASPLSPPGAPSPSGRRSSVSMLSATISTTL